MNRIQEFLKSPQYEKKRNALILILLVVIIPLTVWIAQQQQELRQRAQQEPLTPPTPTVTLQLSSPFVSLTPGQIYQTKLLVNAGAQRITGIDLTLTFDRSFLTMQSFKPAPVFNSELINKIDATAGAMRYSAVDTVGNTPTETFVLGILTFQAGATEGTSSVAFQNVQITGLGQVDPLTNIQTSPTTVTLALPTPTPTPIPTSTPTPSPTPIPTNTPTPTPLPLEGDVNGDRSVDILDFNIWRNEFIGISTTRQSDLNSDGKIDLVDFSIWRNAFNPVSAIPTPTAGISVDKTAVTATLSRANVGTDGLVKGPGFTLTSYGATSWSLFSSTFASGQGFSPTGGGIVPGSSWVVNTFINSNKPNGVYTGSELLKYTQNGVTITGPTISYSITLTN